jgi:integrase
MPRRKQDDQGKPKRRTRGEGTVVRRPDGRYVARVPLGGGKRKEEYYDSRQEADRAKRRMLNERDAGRLATTRDQTFGDYLLYWLKAHRATIRETTYANYHWYLTHRVIPALGHIHLKKLTLEAFQALYQRWERERLAPNTIRRIHGIVNTALKDAVQWRKIPYNPVQGVKLPKVRKAKVHVFSDEEINSVLECARQLRLYVVFPLALLLGMRIGELAGLQWSDIDFEHATLQVHRTVSYMLDPDTDHYRLHVGPPKTEAGERLIHLPQDITKLLQEHHEQQDQMRAAAAHWEDLDLVFCTRSGSYILPNYIRRCFDRLLQIAGMEHMKFHTLRHNASLILRKLKIDPVVRREMLGHRSLDMTDGIYGWTTPNMHKEAAQEIDHWLNNEGGR